MRKKIAKYLYATVVSEDWADDMIALATMKRGWNGEIRHPIKREDIEVSAPKYFEKLDQNIVVITIVTTLQKILRWDEDCNIYFGDELMEVIFDKKEDMIEYFK